MVTKFIAQKNFTVLEKYTELKSPQTNLGWATETKKEGAKPQKSGQQS